MTVQNIIYYRGLDFEDYLKMPGTSFSSIKDFQGPPSTGMQLGTRVHNYLNEPEKFDWVDAETVIVIATELKRYLGDAYTVLEKEVAFTADFIHNGMALKFRGRADMLRIGRIVVDLKILAGGLDASIARFGYDKQISGYCYGGDAPVGLILAFNKAKKIVETKLIKPNDSFWNYQIVRLGQPLKKLS